MCNPYEVPDPKEFALLVARVMQMLPELNNYDELPSVTYDDPNANQRYRDAANGILPGVSCSIKDPSFHCSDLQKLFENAHSRLAQAAALNVYKKARAVVFDNRFDTAFREELYAALEEIKEKHRRYGQTYDVVGSKENPNWWIYAYENNGPMVREVRIKSKKPGMKPLEIVQFSDPHFNYCNEADFAEANPALMSTFQNRHWHAHGDSVDVVNRSFAYAAMSDQTIVTGDILDYLSRGGQELTQKHLFWRDANLLAAIGGHEFTRQMQGEVKDSSTPESRYAVLQSFWCNDIFYESRLLGGRVLAVVLDNGSTAKYTQSQYYRLQADIASARQNDWILLIFQHEPLCTANPAETNVEFIRPNDPHCSHNFFEDYIGGTYTKTVQKDEWTMKTWELIRQSSDVIKGLFCGHLHCDFYTEVLGIDQNGAPDGTVIPQYILTATVYDNLGHMLKITVD